MANKLLKPKRGRVENLPKLAVEDGSLIFAYDTKSPTSTVLVDVGETRYELSAATAKKADDSSALGGSSLQNIVDKINNATGDGTAFTGLDTTTNNKVKLTRANGTTVEKTVDNVSNASTADYAKVSNKVGTGTVGSSTKPVYINAGTPTAISSIPSTFVAAQQINGVNLDTLRTPGMYWAGGGNTNTSKPTGIDAFGLEVLQSAAGWYTQICYASDDQEKQFVRYYDAGTKVWKDWVEQNRLNTKTQSGYAPAPNAANKVYRTDASGNPGWGTLNDSSISKLASTVTFGDGNGMRIEQNGDNWRQRINIFDSSQTTQSYSYQQSTDAGKTYKDLFVIGNDGTVVASAFQGALKGTADYSKNSGALGGSSLKNIIDKINNSTGDGTAFTDLDTTTNNKVKLTRVNGSTVEKTINNVSNASTANYAKIAAAGTANYLYRNPASRSTSANLTITGLGGLRTFKATSSMTEGKPPVGDAHIIHLDWDNTGGYDAQIAVQAAKNGHMAVRGMGSSVWGSWNTVLDSANYTNYAAKKNAYNSASISNATITLGRSDGSAGTTLTVNNVAHALTADLAKNSNALGGSSLKNITDKIDNSIAANDAMHYMGTLGAESQSPTITTLPATARTGDAYKVITAGTYASITAEVGDLFIYSGAWTLIPSGDDGNVYVGDSKSSKFAAKSNNIVVAVGDQKVASAANVTANAGTISALQSTLTQLKASQGTVTTLSGNKATFSTVNGYLNGIALNANILAQYQWGSQMYATGDTHILELGYLKCDASYQNLTLYVTSAFWGNRHGSADFVNIQQDIAGDTPAVKANIRAIRIGGSHDRVFYAVKDQTNKRLYIYVKVEGGNSYGKWNVSVVQCSSGYAAWVSEITANVPLPSENEVISKIYPGTANNSNALGGSSLKNIIDAINNSSADASTKYLPLTGGTLSGKLQVNDVVYGYRYAKKNDAPAFVFDKPGTGLTGIGAHGTDTIYFSAVTNDGNFNWNNDYKQKWVFNGTVTATTVTADYFNGLAANSQKLGGYSLTSDKNYFDAVPFIRADGVMEVGKYFDFHNASAGTTDYDVRIQADSSKLSIVGGSATTVVAGYFDGNAKNADTVDGFHAIDSNNLTASATSAKIVLAKNVVSYIDSLGLATTSQLEWIEF